MKEIPKGRKFIARAIYHHGTRTNEFATLLVYQDTRDGVFELWDDREAEHDCESGTEGYIFEQWGNRNRQAVEDGFHLDNLMGENRWQKFIT